MREIYNRKKSLGLVLLLTMLVQIFVPFLETGKVYAKNGDQIVQNLEIVGGVKGEYRPGETIVVKGEWKLPNDSPNSEYIEGDSFSISVPKGLTPAFGKITLGDMGEGRVVGDKVVFTFNENIEQLMNRNGGFTLMFTVDTPDEEGESELPLIFEDDEEKELIKENSKVNYEKGEVIGTSKENVGKARMSYKEDGIEWYIRVNMSNELKDEGTVTLVDNLVGNNHRIKYDSFRIEHQYIADNSTPKHEVSFSNLVVSEDGQQFTMDLDIEDGVWYTIYYETEYIGNYLEDIKNADNLGRIDLKNELAVYTKNKGVLYPGNTDESKPVKSDFNLGGWAKGDSGYGKLSIIKEDLVTGEKLKGASFKVEEIKTGEEYIVKTDDNGIAKVSNTDPDWLTGGKYIIKEVTAPEGYKLDFEEQIVNIGNNREEKIVIKNEAILNIEVNKKWLNYKGNKISPQEDIAVQLLANGTPVRQGVLTKEIQDMDEGLIFKNLPKYSKDGEEINYSVKEIVPEGYEENPKIEGDAEKGFTITNKKLEPKTSFTLKKVAADDQDKLLSGAEFELVQVNENDKPLEGGYKKELKVENESLEVEDIPVGFYQLIETKAPEGYILDKEPIKLEVTEEGKLIRRNEKSLLNLFSTEEELTELKVINIEETELAVEKIWDGKQVKNILVNLFANGKMKDTIKLDESNSWKHTFTGLNKTDKEGNEIKYEIREIVPEGYEATYEVKGNKTIITNRFIPEETELVVEKKWDGKELESIEVELVGNDEVKDTVTLSKDTSWKHTFTGLDKTDKEGNEIKYEIREIVPEGYEATYEVEGNKTTITNRFIPEETELIVEKKWEGKELESIKVELVGNAEVKDTVTLSKDTGWKHTFTGLNKTDKEGNEIKYEIREIVPEGYEATYEVEGNKTTITNRFIPEETELIVEKKWDGKELESIKVELLGNDEVKDTAVLSKDTGWKYTFTGLDKTDKEGNEIKYEIREIVPEGYEATYEELENGKIIITNTELPEPEEPEDPEPEEPEEPEIPEPEEPEKTVLKVEKKWDGKALDSVDVQLIENGIPGQIVKLSSANSWSYEFKDLLKYDSNGEEIVYEVKELEVPKNYEVSYEELENGKIIITNTETPEPEEPEEPETPEPEEPEEPETPEPVEPEKTVLEIEKKWDGKALDSVKVQLLENGIPGQIVELNSGNRWHHVFGNLLKYDSNGEEIVYEVKELEVPENYEVSYEKLENGKIIITNTEIPEPEEPEDPEPVEPEEPEEPETPEPVEPEEPEEDEDGSKNPNKPGDEEPEEDVDGVIVEKPEDPEEDEGGSGSKNPNKPGDKEEIKTDTSQEIKLPKTGSNSLDYYLLGLLLLLIGLLLKKRERVAN